MAHPYAWTWYVGVGPLHGLSTMNNSIHGLNYDGHLLAEQSAHLVNLDPEVTYVLILRNSFDPAFRWRGEHGAPSRFSSASILPPGRRG